MGRTARALALAYALLIAACGGGGGGGGTPANQPSDDPTSNGPATFSIAPLAAVEAVSVEGSPASATLHVQMQFTGVTGVVSFAAFGIGSGRFGLGRFGMALLGGVVVVGFALGIESPVAAGGCPVVARALSPGTTAALSAAASRFGAAHAASSSSMEPAVTAASGDR